MVGPEVAESAPVSTSRSGVGSEPDSGCTPPGWHRVKEIIGTGGAADQEYISRLPVPPSDREDRILSRILWLDGLEPGLNDTSAERYIYLHGTNQTDALGTPASAGCIRMHPETIANWTDRLADKVLLVWIGTGS
jgi:lipoprotein-anchoring transpeptidase ErfK/SrfK